MSIQPEELIVDNFAGGGGASLGIEWALGRSPDIAVNHDREAVAMHSANHPATRHFCEDVFAIDPKKVCGSRPVGLAWFSPDCKHFSKAKGGKPVSKKIRGLAWVVVRWAKAVRPRVIILENVEEFQSWGPLTDDGLPCPIRKGFTFRRWWRQLENLGYRVEWRELRACDYGAPTIRKRLFVVARCDGEPIRWPSATHGDPKRIGGTPLFPDPRLPWRTAAECIDWSLPCPSIFERERPLAEKTLRRVAAGIRRYVIEAAEPFIVGVGGPSYSGKPRGVEQPLHTLTAQPRSAICVPTLIQTGYGERDGQAPRVPGLDKPLGTAVSGQKHALVSAFLAKHYGGVVGSSLGESVGTVTSTDHHSLVTSHLVKLRGTCRHGQPVDEPLATVSAQGTHLAEVRTFLECYLGDGATPRVVIKGQEYVIADIGLRMLSPRELFRAQGFPDTYIIDPTVDGKPLSKSAQVRMCGNSVCPPIAAAVARAQFAAVEREAVA